MNYVDIISLVVLAAGFIHGFIKGAILEVAAAVALVVGVIIAGKAASGATAVTGQLSNPAIGKIFVFVIVFIIVAILVGLLGRLLSNLAKQANLSTIDRLLGAVIGVCLVGIALGLVFKILTITGTDSPVIANSAIAQRLMNAVSYLTRFLPGSGGAATASPAITASLFRE